MKSQAGCSPVVHAPGLLRRRREPCDPLLRRHARLREELAYGRRHRKNLPSQSYDTLQIDDSDGNELLFPSPE